MDRAFWLVDLGLKKSPQMAILYYQKARLQWKNKEYGLSVENFEKAIDLNVELLEPHLFLAQIYFRDQDLKTAERHYEKVIELEPRKFEALVGLAKIYKIQGKTQKELVFLEKAQKVRPRNEWVKKELSKFVAKASLRGPAARAKNSNGGGQ